MKTSKTAAAIITGNEILSGKVTEQNGRYLAQELRALGVSLERIVIVPDQIDRIAEEISLCHPRFDMIFTTGGIGPTHDDITLEAVAKGVNRRCLPHPVLSDILKAYHKSDNARIKMASVPEGTELIYGEGLRTPILKIKNIYVFPGVFEFFRKKFDVLKERFRDTPFYLAQIFIRWEEDRIVEMLHKTLEHFPGLIIGSYPVLDQADYKVVVTLESKEAQAVKEGAAALAAFLPDEAIWKIKEAC